MDFWSLELTHFSEQKFKIFPGVANRQSVGAELLSVQFSLSVVSDSLWLHESQHASLPVHHQLPEFTQTHGVALVMPKSLWPHGL